RRGGNIRANDLLRHAARSLPTSVAVSEAKPPQPSTLAWSYSQDHVGQGSILGMHIVTRLARFGQAYLGDPIDRAARSYPSAAVTLTRTRSPACKPLPLTRTVQSMSGASAWLRAKKWFGTSGSGPSMRTSSSLPTCPLLQPKAISC